MPGDGSDHEKYNGRKERIGMMNKDINTLIIDYNDFIERSVSYHSAKYPCITREDMEDIAQEVRIKMLRMKDTFKEERNTCFATYLNKAIENTVKDMAPKRYNHMKRCKSIEEVKVEEPYGGAIEEKAVDQYMSECFLNILKEEYDKTENIMYKKALIAIKGRFQGESLNSMAKLLDVDFRTLWVYVNRMQKKLYYKKFIATIKKEAEKYAGNAGKNTKIGEEKKVFFFFFFEDNRQSC